MFFSVLASMRRVYQHTVYPLCHLAEILIFRFCSVSPGHYGKENLRSGGQDMHNFISSGFVTLGRGHLKGNSYKLSVQLINFMLCIGTILHCMVPIV